MELGDHRREGGLERPGEGATAGVAVSATVEDLGDSGDIDLALAAQAGAELGDSGGRNGLAEERRALDSGDSDEVIDDAFSVLGVGPGAGHFVQREGAPGDFALDLHVGEGYGQKADFAGGV